MVFDTQPKQIAVPNEAQNPLLDFECKKEHDQKKKKCVQKCDMPRIKKYICARGHTTFVPAHQTPMGLKPS